MPPECLADTHREALAEILAGARAGTLRGGTERRIHGRTALPGKATAVVGIRRAGKTP